MFRSVRTLPHRRRGAWWKAAIITAALVLSGCSTLRFSYNQAPHLAWWWIDGYADFGDAQSPAVKRTIAAWFDWHRASELPRYAAWLGSLQPQVLDPVTPAQMCRINEQARTLLQPAIDRAMEMASEHVQQVSEAQLRHVEQRQRKANEDARDDYLQPDPDDRRKAAVKRAVGRFETLYGRLTEPQRRLVEASVAASPFDARQWMVERERRQLDLVQLLRQLTAQKATRAQAAAALKQLADGWDDSPRPEYRQRQALLTQHNCQLAADVHNAANRQQRERARDTLRGWEQDLRALAAEGAAAQAAQAPAAPSVR